MQKKHQLYPSKMKAMVMEAPGQPLVLKNLDVPKPAADQVLVKIIACGVCRTDLHIMDGELSRPKLPLVMGHEIIARVVRTGTTVLNLREGDLVGIPWLGYTCGKCRYCLKGMENLCENAQFTGYDIDGGYAEYTLAHQDYCFPLDPSYGNPTAASLMCAGLIGYRSYKMIDKNAKRIGLYGFGAAASLLIQLANWQKKEIYAFTRDEDRKAQQFALRLGAAWAGDSSQTPPKPMDASIIFAPVGPLIPKALQDVDKGGTVVCGGIHMSDIPSFPYDILWEERTLRSVANLTRMDATDYLAIAPKIPVKANITTFKLEEANMALEALRNGKLEGAAVLVMD
ncbi:zinc-dependent alcohol dehydrogenase family protein [Pedobacter sp. ASV28]|uniref:zinc-dependent alcohol dehydrogenase family protein n=1 Tax=Pedobacter sp. ASV28 TaxID=2795123 RepID=UPI0018EDAC6B|nr:zinc-dependent alcohol dehydrogenase family protein [Pedobacter sp. ASV28]